MRAARPRRGLTLVELMVVIAVLLILMAIAVPSFLGARGLAADAAAKSAVAVGYHEAKSAWANDGEYPTLGGAAGLLSQMGSGEPDLRFQTTTPAVRDPHVIWVASWDPQVIVLCSQSASGTFFCLESDETGQLGAAATGLGQTGIRQAGGIDIARSHGSSLEAALCLLPARGAETTVAWCDLAGPGESAGAGWDAR